jgi:glyceraldehyde-3-phosphate dehydrogenase/erythrose-4-phosphate dehydrogenase
VNDQNLVDNMHKKYRRGRAAALNMVITETGAGSAVAKALPSLEGKLTSNAIRVPVWFFGCFEFRSVKNNFGSGNQCYHEKYALEAK